LRTQSDELGVVVEVGQGLLVGLKVFQEVIQNLLLHISVLLSFFFGGEVLLIWGGEGGLGGIWV
jgi:hypothetical protein